MISLIVEGISLGLAVSILLGPVFFSLIHTSINRGFHLARFMAYGISLSDAMYILICYSGLAQLENSFLAQQIMSLGGGLVLIIFGFTSMIKKSKKTDIQSDEIIIDKNLKLKLFLKGFMLNTINPAVLMFWIGTVGLVSVRLEYYNYKVFTFFFFTVLTIFSTDIFKIYISRKLINIITEKILTKLNIASGLFLIIFGLKLIYNFMSENNILF